MKKNFFAVALATLAVVGMASCSNDDEVVKNNNGLPKEAIGFNVNHTKGIGTRGTEGAVSDIETNGFSVWAFDATTNGVYMGSASTGIAVSGSNTGGWTYSPVQYWPTNNLKFMAVTPNSAVTTHTASITELVDDVTIPECANQKDIMYAAQQGDGNGINYKGTEDKVALNFNHALAAIHFKGYLDNVADLKSATVEEITIVNANSVGKIHFTPAGEFDYSNLSTPITYTAGINGSTKLITTKDVGTPNVLTATDGVLMLLPQTMEAGRETTYGSEPTDIASKAYLKVRAKLVNQNDQEILSSDQATYIPLTIKWEQGKRYTYTIKFTANGLTPIVFGDVSVTEWTAVDGGTLNY